MGHRTRDTVDWAMLVRVLVERAPQPTLVLDPVAGLQACNAALAQLLGRSRESLEGHGWLEVSLAQNGRAKVEQALSDVMAGVLQRVDLPVQSRQGEEMVLSVQFQTVPAAGGLAAVGSVVAVRRAAAWARTHFAGFRMYEISALREQFGVVQYVGSAEPGDELAIGRHCFSGLHGEQSPCANCPAFSRARPGDIRTGVVSRHGSQALCLVTAEFTASDTIRVGIRMVSDRDLRDLLAAKLDRLTHQAGLSDRERKVLDLIIEGHDGQTIGELLEIAPRTVKFHQANALRKLGVESRIELLKLLL